jgi:hypothetical protein
MKKLAVVLGFHRSGTSLVSKSLGCLGFSHGNRLMGGDDFNKKGYFEDLEIVNLNERILNSLGKSWDSHFIHDNSNFIYSKFYAEARETVAKKLTEHQSFALKDPRIPQLMSFWHRVFSSLPNTDTFYIHAIRNPVDVAHSLIRRNGQPFESWLDRWYETETKIFNLGLTAKLLTVESRKMFVMPEQEIERLGSFLDAKIDRNLEREYITQFLNTDLFSSTPNGEADHLNHPANKLFELQIAESPLLVEDLLHIEKSVSSTFWIRRISQIRDQLLTERDQLLTERDQLLTERDQLLTERDQLLTERDQLLTERDQLLTERDQLLTERSAILSSKSWKITKPLRLVGKRGTSKQT